MIKKFYSSYFTNTASSSSIPKYYGEALVALAKEDPRVVTLTGDLAPAKVIDLFREAFLSRFFASGIAEANLIGLVAGMASGGDMRFVHSFSVFLHGERFIRSRCKSPIHY